MRILASREQECRCSDKRNESVENIADYIALHLQHLDRKKPKTDEVNNQRDSTRTGIGKE